MFSAAEQEKLILIIKKKYPELSDEDLDNLAHQYFQLAIFLVQLWIKKIDKSSKDPPS